MPNILESLKRRKVSAAKVRFQTLPNGVVDLTTESEDEQDERDEPRDSPKVPEKVCSEDIEPKPEPAEKITCPICVVDIARLTLEERESHVELCLLRPSTSTVVFQRSQKLQKTENKSQKQETKPRKPRKPKRPLPDFKIVTLEPHKVIVDGFCYADGPTDKYFLSHFHADHYGGLTKGWSQGVIYCSRITADLAMNMFKIPSERFIVLTLNEPITVENDLTVTLYDANHCPGAVIFLFSTPAKKVLHTGDFRVSKEIIDTFLHTHIDEIYLDTTYLNPQYAFYDQRLVINSTVTFISSIINSTKRTQGILQFLNGNAGGHVILIGSYSIGKEKIYIDIARALKTKIFVTERRYQTLKLSGMDMSLFQCDTEEGCMIYVVNFDKLNDKVWLKRFAKRHVIRVRPTGWSFSRLKKISTDVPDDADCYDIYGTTVKRVLTQCMTRATLEEQLKAQWERGDTLAVPYSEHSSFKELTIFGSILKWGKMIPTVSVDNQEFPKWFGAWKRASVDYEVVEKHFGKGPWDSL